MNTPKILHPINTDEFGFYKTYFTISNINANDPLTPKAIDVIASICSSDKNFLDRKQFKHDLANRLNVKTPRVYKLLTELKEKGILLETDSKYTLVKGLVALQSNVKYLLEKGESQFNYELMFNVK